ncbi:ComF family protein [Terriglobus roseus]|nr:ComF family protein [Terriglobus roseus]
MASVASGRLGGRCYRCAEPLGYEPSYQEFSDDVLCADCSETPPPFARATAFGSYELMRHALRLFKFGNVRSLALPMGGLLAEAILEQAEGMPESLLVIPVPLFRRRRLYNQSLLLADAAMRVVQRRRPLWKMELAPHRLRRVHHKESQYRLSPEERRENVRGAFQVRGSVRGRQVLLVDDVYTTGATVTECTEVLLAAGAESVRVVTLARAGSQIPVLWTAPAHGTEYSSHKHFGNPIYPHPVQ